MLNFECGRDLLCSRNQPEHVNQANCVAARHVANCCRKLRQATVAQSSRSKEPPTVVGGYPDVKPERFAKIAEPSLDFGMGTVTLARGL